MAKRSPTLMFSVPKDKPVTGVELAFMTNDDNSVFIFSGAQDGKHSPLTGESLEIASDKTDKVSSSDSTYMVKAGHCSHCEHDNYFHAANAADFASHTSLFCVSCGESYDTSIDSAELAKATDLISASNDEITLAQLHSEVAGEDEEACEEEEVEEDSEEEVANLFANLASDSTDLFELTDAETDDEGLDEIFEEEAETADFFKRLEEAGDNSEDYESDSEDETEEDEENFEEEYESTDLDEELEDLEVEPEVDVATLKFVSDGDTLHVLSQGRPIGFAEKASAIEGIQNAWDSKAVISELANILTEKASGSREDYGFKFYPVSLKSDSLAATKIHQIRKDYASTVDSVVDEKVAALKQGLNIAGLGIIKGIFPNKNPIREALIRKLETAGLDDAAELVDTVLSETASEFCQNLLIKGVELSEKSEEIRNETATLVRDAATATTSLSDKVTASLVRNSMKLVVNNPQPVIETAKPIASNDGRSFAKRYFK
jgi:hypothetical protein